jgi:magnesium transporter
MKLNIKPRARLLNTLTPEFFGEQFLDAQEIQLFTYDQDSFNENTKYNVDSAEHGYEEGKVKWLNIHGLHDSQLISNICKKLNLPLFIIQDILDTSQRTKVQDLGDYVFISIRSILPSENHDFEVEQISFILGENMLLSFQEKKGDHFEHVRVRIRENAGLVRKKGADFLLFLLIQGIVENYFATIDQLELSVREEGDPLKVDSTDPTIVSTIEGFKRKLLQLRKNITALRDGMSRIEKGTVKMVGEDQLKYYFDLKDNCLNLLESIDALELWLESAENLFFSMQGHKMNQVMTTLTIMAAIFIPLTFFAGIYGMNFEYMPELQWKYSYFILLGTMAILAVGLIYYFKKKKWF